MTKICKDGRLFGQNNSYKKPEYIEKQKLAWKKNHPKYKPKEKKKSKWSIRGEWNTDKKGTFKKGQTAWNKGKPYTAVKGNKNGNWKGGITNFNFQDFVRKLPKYKQWRFNVYKRDNWTCQTCGKMASGQLQAHHIKPFSEILREFNIKTIEDSISCSLLWDTDNGVTLCQECHLLTRTQNKKIKQKGWLK